MIGIILLLAIAFSFFIWPYWDIISLRVKGAAQQLQRRRARLILAVCLIGLSVMAIGMYHYWGAYRTIRIAHLVERVHRDGPEQLIERMRARLRQSPRDAQGWYWLGRLYLYHGQLQKAEHAFEHAYDLKPDQAELALRYIQAVWLRKHHLNPKAKRALKQLQRHKNAVVR